MVYRRWHGFRGVINRVSTNAKKAGELFKKAGELFKKAGELFQNCTPVFPKLSIINCQLSSEICTELKYRRCC
jgi:hypothetical protein